MRVLRLAFIVSAIGIIPAATSTQSPQGRSTPQSQSPAYYATAADVIGKAQRRVSTNPEKWAPLNKGDRVAADSAVQTAANSAVLLSLPGQHVVRIGENTTLEVKQAGQNNAYSFSLLKGRIWSYVNGATKPAKYEVESASVTLGVSGTLFSVAHDETTDELDASVQEGQVRMHRGAVQQTLNHGFQMRVLQRRLAMAKPLEFTPATREMWKTVGTSEAWAKPGGQLRLNPQVETRARAVVQERKQQRAAAARGRGRGRG
jgi:hypothetical protein